jgi:hypothetical protein
MKRLLAVILCTAATVAFAQNPNLIQNPIVPTAPPGTNTNQTASTAFVSSASSQFASNQFVANLVAGSTSQFASYTYLFSYVTNQTSNLASTTFVNSAIATAFITATASNLLINGTTSPTNQSLLEVNPNGSLTPLASSTIAAFVNTAGSPTRVLIDAYSNGTSNAVATLTGRTSRGTATTQSAVQTGDQLAVFNAIGYGQTAYSSTPTAAIQIMASQPWTNANQGSQIVIQTTKNSTVSPANAMVIDGLGHVLPGGPQAPSITAGCNGSGSSVRAGSSDHSGAVTGQTSVATSCTVTFGNAYANTPFCIATSENGTITAVTPSASTLVVTFSSIVNPKFDYVCYGS